MAPRASLAPIRVPTSPFPSSEKSPLPAIIVTPSSPTSKTDFSIAFLAPEAPPPILRSAIASFFNSFFSTTLPPTMSVRTAGQSSLPSYISTPRPTSSSKRLKTSLILALPIAIIAFHIISLKFQLFGYLVGDAQSASREWTEHNPAIVATGL